MCVYKDGDDDGSGGPGDIAVSDTFRGARTNGNIKMSIANKQ